MEHHPDQRHFHCDHCNGRISIPYDLPVTIAPCPHCELVITSPPAPQPEGGGFVPRPKPVLSENSGWVKAWSPPMGQNSGKVAALSPLGQNSGRVVATSPLGQNAGRVSPATPATPKMTLPGEGRSTPPNPLAEARPGQPSALNQVRVGPDLARAVAAAQAATAAPNRVMASASFDPNREISAPSGPGQLVEAAPEGPLKATEPAPSNQHGDPAGPAPVSKVFNDDLTAKVKLNPVSLWLATARVKLIAPKKSSVSAETMTESERIQSAALPAHVGPSIAMRGAAQEMDPRSAKFGQDTMLVRARLEKFNLVPVKPISSSVSVAAEDVDAPVAQLKEGSPKAAPKAKSSKRLLLVAAALPLVLGAGAFAYFQLMPSKEVEPFTMPTVRKVPAAVQPAVQTPAIDEEAFIASGWKEAASATITGFLGADSASGKLPFVMPSGDVAGRMGAFYLEADPHETTTPVSGFVPIELTEKDRRRGLFLMVYNLPAAAKEDAAPEAKEPEMVRVLAFFKRKDDKLLLDWDTYAQSKYRTFKRFVEAPDVGASATFRVKMLPVDGGTAKILLHDPAYPQDQVTVEVASDSAFAKELAAVEWGRTDTSTAARTATLDLRWDKQKQLRVNEFICWEFYGLGGDAPAAK